jgi:hypothetical protein
MEYISNSYIMQFVSDHWLFLVLLYAILSSVFPNSKLLERLKEKVTNIFPFLKSNKLKG